MISEVRLSNYRIFKGSHCLELDDGKATVIVSANAAGKTSLLSSIYWCLYGQQREIDEDKCSILNLEVAESIEEGNSAQVSVAITIQSDDQTLVLCRSADFVKKSGSIVKEHEYTFINHSHDDTLFLTSVNNLFPRQYAPIFFWEDDYSYRIGRKIKLEEYFTLIEIDSIMQLANQIFNKIYFRPGQYELIYNNALLAKEIITGLCDCFPSADDSLMMNLSVFLAACLTVRKKQPTIGFPILVDSVLSHIQSERIKKPVDLLFYKSQFQIIMTLHKAIIEDLQMADTFSLQSCKVYEIKSNCDSSASIIDLDPQESV